MTLSNFPTLIVEFGFESNASTSNYWHIGDTARGVIGTAAVGSDAGVWTDVTADVLAAQMQAGSSSRIVEPIVTFEAGTLTLQLNNIDRQYDPLNTHSPYYSQGTTTVTLPPSVPNAIAALAQGDALDARVATTTPGAQAVAIEATGVGAANQATVTGTSTGGVVPTGMLFGSSGFASAGAASNTLSILDPAIGRAYESLSTTNFSGTQYMRLIPSSKAQFATFKGNTAVWADPSSNTALYNTQRDNGRTMLQGLSPRKGHAASYWHEPRDEVTAGTFTQAQWIQANINFKADVIDYVNANNRDPSAPIFCFPCIQGEKPNDNATMNGWFPASLLAVIDGINWDCYGYDGTGDQVQSLHDFAKLKGMPWSVGELGYSVKTGPDNATILATMQHLFTLIGGWPTSERPIFVSWFNNGNNLLNGLTTAPTYWKGACENQSVQP